MVGGGGRGNVLAIFLLYIYFFVDKYVAEVRGRRGQGSLRCVLVSGRRLPRRLARILNRLRGGTFRFICSSRKGACLTRKCNTYPAAKCAVRIGRLCRARRAIYLRADLVKPTANRRAGRVAAFPCVIIRVDKARGRIVFS